MVLAKADPRISTMYDRLLVPTSLWSMGDELRRRLDVTKRSVLSVGGKASLLEGEGVAQVGRVLR